MEIFPRRISRSKLMHKINVFGSRSKCSRLNLHLRSHIAPAHPLGSLNNIVMRTSRFPIFGKINSNKNYLVSYHTIHKNQFTHINHEKKFDQFSTSIRHERFSPYESFPVGFSELNLSSCDPWGCPWIRNPLNNGSRDRKRRVRGPRDIGERLNTGAFVFGSFADRNSNGAI